MKLARMVVVVMALAACKKAQPEAPALTPPTTEEAAAFAKEFAKHMSAPCNRDAVTRDLDIDLMVRRSIVGHRISESEVAGIKSGLVGSLVTSLCEAAAVPPSGGAPSYQLLRVRTVDGEPRPLLRLSGEAGITYHELTLDKRDGLVRIADMLMYATGETFSQMVSTMFDAMSDYNDTQPLIEAKRKLSAGDPKGARLALGKLSDELRQTKTVMMFDVTAASALDDEAEYLKAIDAFEARFPGDPALDLVGIDQAYLRKDFKKALKHIDSLDKRLGGDPALDVQRAGAYIELGDYAEAVKVAQRGTKAAPEIPELWWTLLTAQVGAKQFAPALDTIETLKSKFQIEIDEAALRADPRFTALADSAELRAAKK